MKSFIKEKAITMVSSKLSVYLLASSILGCLLLYVYFANMAVRTLAVLEKSKSEMQILTLEVSELESKRIAMDNTISNDLAKGLGFVEVKNQNFIVDNLGTILSFKSN